MVLGSEGVNSSNFDQGRQKVKACLITHSYNKNEGKPYKGLGLFGLTPLQHGQKCIRHIIKHAKNSTEHIRQFLVIQATGIFLDF